MSGKSFPILAVGGVEIVFFSLYTGAVNVRSKG